MKRILSIFLISLCTFGCQNKKKEEIKPVLLTSSLDSMATDLLLNRNYSMLKCDCKDTSTQTKPNLIFTFKNGKQISLCGYYNDGESGPKGSYSEFILSECESQDILNSWDALNNCEVKFENDTLAIGELFSAPNGKNFNEVYQPLFITRYYYFNNSLRKDSFLNKSLRAYTQEEIKKIIQNYKPLTNNTKNTEEIINVVKQLYWAYYSNSKEAENILENLCKIQCGDGYIAEEYNIVIEMYKKSKINHSDR